MTYQAQFAPQPQYARPSSIGDPLDGASHPDDLSRPLYGATPVQAVTRFFKNYARFSGRASLSEYWWAQLAVALMMVPSLALCFAGMANSDASYGDRAGSGSGLLMVGGWLLFATVAAIIVPMYALGWRRMHDAGFAGPMYLLGLIPSVGGIITLVLALMGSKPAGRVYDV